MLDLDSINIAEIKKLTFFCSEFKKGKLNTEDIQEIRNRFELLISDNEKKSAIVFPDRVPTIIDILWIFELLYPSKFEEFLKSIEKKDKILYNSYIYHKSGQIEVEKKEFEKSYETMNVPIFEHKGPFLVDVDKLLKIRSFKNVLNNYPNIDFESITNDLNDWIHNYGDEGYEDAERFNLKVGSKYSVLEVKHLLELLIETSRESKKKVIIKKIKTIPTCFAAQLIKDANNSLSASSYLVNYSSKFNIGYGIFRGNEIIGYVGGCLNDRCISIVALYIKSDYRGNGYGSLLLRLMMNLAFVKGLKGLYMGNPSHQGMNSLLKLKTYYDKLGYKNIDYSEFNEDLKNKATLYFIDRVGYKKAYFI